MKLSDHELKKYSRHILLEEIGIEGQLKLKSSRVMVVGAGGLGCPVLTYLAAAGVGFIGIVDYDKVELSNLPRQVLYGYDDIGKFKSDCAMDYLFNINPLLRIISFNVKLTVENAIELFSNYDLIIDCTDNFSTRYLINDGCVLLNLPFVYAGISKFEALVSVFNYKSEGYNGATYRCAFPDPPLADAIKSCAEEGVLGVLPGIAGTIQATEAIKIITGNGKILSGVLLIINSLDMNFQKIVVSRNENVWKNFPADIEAFNKMNYDIFCGLSQAYKSIESNELKNMIASGKQIQFIDVRKNSESPESGFDNVIKISPDEIDDLEFVPDENKINVFFCSSGNRSKRVIESLSKKFNSENFYNLEGGLNNWLK